MILIEMSLNQNVGKRQSKLMTTRKLHFSCEKMDVISVVLTHHSSWPCCLLLLPRRHGAGSTPTPHNFLVTSHQSPHRIPSSREQL